LQKIGWSQQANSVQHFILSSIPFQTSHSPQWCALRSKDRSFLTLSTSTSPNANLLLQRQKKKLAKLQQLCLCN